MVSFRTFSNPFLNRLAKYTHYITGLNSFEIGDIVESFIATKDSRHFGRVIHNQLQKFRVWATRNAAAGVECAVCHLIISISSVTPAGYANIHVLPCCFSTVHMECFTKLFLLSYGKQPMRCPRCKLSWERGSPQTSARGSPPTLQIWGQQRLLHWTRSQQLWDAWWDFRELADNKELIENVVAAGHPVYEVELDQ